MSSAGRGAILGLCALVGFGLLDARAANRVPVIDEVERLASQYGFSVTGLSHTAGAWGRVEDANLQRRLRTLLEEYDYVMVAGPGGAVTRLIILGAKSPWTPPEPPPGAGRPSTGDAAQGGDIGDIVLATTRHGAQHAVVVALEGTGGQRVQQAMVIDTGAELVVLPTSLLPRLGLDPAQLEDREVQTANGRTLARLGQLSGIWLDQKRVADVDVAFIDDERLGGHALLGMNVLGRYRLTIDDERSELRLLTR
ncbi:retropepsin-like aspartic protease [Thioalkalicoccus limnaeus]|uniref:Retropepsin-like aspartic protease n=1 Tax=Thioalkalicoccus limnaeus TaxID=120681 RepID=A0ABV4BC49_9GAMM